MKKGASFIFINISDHVTLNKSMVTYIKFNHVINITGCWIYDSNSQKKAFLN